MSYSRGKGWRLLSQGSPKPELSLAPVANSEYHWRIFVLILLLPTAHHGVSLEEKTGAKASSYLKSRVLRKLDEHPRLITRRSSPGSHFTFLYTQLDNKSLLYHRVSSLYTAFIRLGYQTPG